MNRDEFDKLEILDQIDYMNKGLESTSLTKVCASIGIDRATVRKRFKSNGYVLKDNKYIQVTTTTDNTVNTKKLTTTNIKTT